MSEKQTSHQTHIAQVRRIQCISARACTTRIALLVVISSHQVIARIVQTRGCSHIALRYEREREKIYKKRVRRRRNLASRLGEIVQLRSNSDARYATVIVIVNFLSLLDSNNAETRCLRSSRAIVTFLNKNAKREDCVHLAGGHAGQRGSLSADDGRLHVRQRWRRHRRRWWRWSEARLLAHHVQAQAQL